MTKADTVAACLRDGIVRGDFAAGDQLPTWDSLEQRFSVTRPTLTRAIDRLKRDGFVRTTRSRGTFVSDRLPHLTRYGLVFPSHPSWHYSGPGGWNQFWDLLARTAPALEAQLDLDLPVFFEVTSERTKGYQRLSAELRAGRLGGLILVGNHQTLQLPVVTDQAVPMVMIYDDPKSAPCPCVYVDLQSFVDRSLDILQQAKRRRVAVLTNETATFDQFEQVLAARGFDSKPFWRLHIHQACAQSVVRLLLDYPREEAPDALIVADDNLVEEALAGILAAGVAVPSQLTVVTHCNWPRPLGGAFPAVRLGFDVREVLQTCVRLLQQQRKGTAGPRMTRLPAKLEAEIAASPGTVPADGMVRRETTTK